MRKHLFFFLAAFAASPLLTGCVGLPNPQSEWTTTAGVGDEPPVSDIQGSVDLSALVVADPDPGVDVHVELPGHHDERPVAHRAEAEKAEHHEEHAKSAPAAAPSPHPSTTSPR